MIKRDYPPPSQEEWDRLPLWLRWKIAAIVAWSTWRRWTWEAWLRFATGYTK